MRGGALDALLHAVVAAEVVRRVNGAHCAVALGGGRWLEGVGVSGVWRRGEGGGGRTWESVSWSVLEDRVSLSSMSRSLIFEGIVRLRGGI